MLANRIREGETTRWSHSPDGPGRSGMSTGATAWNTTRSAAAMSRHIPGRAGVTGR